MLKIVTVKNLAFVTLALALCGCAIVTAPVKVVSAGVETATTVVDVVTDDE